MPIRQIIILLAMSALSVTQLISYHGFSTFLVEFFDRRYYGLFHNLLLAWVPYLATLLLGRLKKYRYGAIGLIAVWFLFLPNAPYMVTDLKYVHENENITMQQSVLLYFSFAITGLLLFWSSVGRIQDTVPFFRGGQVTAGIMALSSLGVWMGRMLRWQSWDIIRPSKLITDLQRAEIIAAVGWIAVLFFLLWLPYQLFFLAHKKSENKITRTPTTIDF